MSTLANIPKRKSAGVTTKSDKQRRPAKRGAPGREPIAAPRDGGNAATIPFDVEHNGASIGAPYETWLDAERLVERGLPFGSLARLSESTGMTLERIKDLVRLPAATFQRRRQSGKLSRAESERVLRLSRLFEATVGLFHGDQSGARRWLETPMLALGNRPPVALSKTDVGAREVEDLIGRIRHGVVS